VEKKKGSGKNQRKKNTAKKGRGESKTIKRGAKKLVENKYG